MNKHSIKALERTEIMLKKITAILTCVILSLSLTACNKGENSNESNSSGESSPKKEKVGFMYSGTVENTVLNKNLENIRKTLNSDNVETVYIENVSASQIDKAVKTLVDAECTTIASTSNKFSKVLYDSAAKYPDIKFINLGGIKSSTNISSYKSKGYQATYIAGVASAYNTKSKKFAVIIESNMPGSLPIINAYALGSQLILPNSQIRVYYANTLEESKKAVDAAISDGCDVLLTYQSNEYAYNYAKTKNVWLVAGEVSTESINKDKTLLSFNSDWSTYYQNQIKSLQENQWKSEIYFGGLNQNNVVIGNISPKASKNTVGVIEQIEQFVRTGQAPIFKGEVKDNVGTIVIFKDITLKPEEIELIEWVSQGVVGAGNFTEINTEEKATSFEIKS